MIDNHYNNWSLKQWLDVLEARNWQEINFNLKRIYNIANTLNVLTSNAKIIHVAGTNSKGSTCASLEYMYLYSGYQVGLYTSPHLLFCNERIRVNGKIITEIDLCKQFAIIEAIRKDIILTYFEAFTLAALLYFKQFALDIIILEVGMGGRLDATNIMHSDLAIITTIDFDHQTYLGNTLEAIGFEKAGIMRPYTPCIYADTKVLNIINDCANILNVKKYFCNQDYQIFMDKNKFNFMYKNTTFEFIHPKLHPHAIASAIMAGIIFKKQLPIDFHSLPINKIFIQGRQQLIKINNRIVLIDVAHNAQSVRFLAEFLRKNYSNTNIHAIFSALSDKDHFALIQPMQALIKNWYPVILHNNRGASQQQLNLAMKKNKIITKKFYNTTQEAYHIACNQIALDDLIIVYGSFIIVEQFLLNNSYVNAESI